MPIYEYRCQFCGKELEKLQRMSDDPLRDCPSCGTAGLRRLISAAGFRLKGSGWYETDFKKDKRRNVADAGDGGQGGEKKQEGGQKDAAETPAAKPEASGASGDKPGADVKASG